MLLKILLIILALSSVSNAGPMVTAGLIQEVTAGKKTVPIGEKITFSYGIRNTGNSPVTYKFSSAQQFDVWVTQGDKELYRYSQGRVFAQMLTTLTINPGATKIFTAEWDQKSPGGQVAPGPYTVSARLTATIAPPPMTLSNFTIGSTAQTVVTINKAITQFNALRDQTVSIVATYRGQTPNQSENCKNGPPMTRSDWTISDDTGCMYVTGPINLDPNKDLGRSVEVTGKLYKTSKGQVYLVLESVNIKP